MNGKICMITGATSGIGKATAIGLAKKGASVILVCRDSPSSEAAAEEIRVTSGNRDVELLRADLSLQADIRRASDEFHERFNALHALINNAGVAPLKRSVTPEGIETVLAVNYLAPFLLTNLLLDTLKASAPARIINVAGDFHRKATIDFSDLMSEKDYSGTRANNQAKLALILFTYELSRRLEGTRVTANCLHPGAVATAAPLKDPDLPKISRLLYSLVSVFFLSPERGAATPIYLASSPQVETVSGKYFIKESPVASSPESYDRQIAARLWEESVRLTSLNA